MENVGTYLIYIIMACAVIDALASIYNSECELGKEFVAGLHSIGPIFIPVAGIMASIPYIASFINHFIAPLFEALGADPGIAGALFIAADMGGYHLANTLVQSPEGWILGLITGFQSGATIIFVVPVPGINGDER